MKKCIKFLGFFFIFLFLAGCEGIVVDNPELFNASRDNCWPCQMYMQAFRAIDTVLDGSLEIIASNSLIVLEMGLLFWLLFKALSLLISFSEPNMKKELATFATIMFKACLVALFLNNPTYLYDFFGKVIIQPFGEGFLSLSKTVLETPTDMGISVTSFDITGYLDNLLDNVREFFGKTNPSSINSTSRMFGGLAVAVYEIVFRIYAALWKCVGLGFQLWNLKGFSATIAGIILVTGMFWLVVMMPLSFVDAFVRIGLMLILLPLLMVGWVFSYPKDIVKKLFHNLLAGFFDILFTCIYISFLISMFRVYESIEIPDMTSSSAQTTERGMRTIADNFGTEFLILTMLAWVMVKLSSKVQDFSKYFFDSAGKSGMIDMVNRLKNIAMKGVRVGATLLSGPLGWATAAGGAAIDATKKAASGEKEEADPDQNNSENQEGEGKKQDNSQKASSSRSAPSEKKENK